MEKLTVAYNRQLGLTVYHALAAGKSYRDIAVTPGMPDFDTMLDWLDHEPEFQRLVSLASADKALSLANEIKVIADGADVNSPATVEKARLQCEVRMWLAGQLWPSKYGSHR